jgi:hypothetical protein
VSSTDKADNNEISVQETFSTDITPPVISEVTAEDITSASAKITWLTNEKSDSKVWYDKTTPLIVTDTTPVASSTDLLLNHEINLTSLTQNTNYYYIVSSTDEAGNNAKSTEKTFTALSQE